MRNHKEADTIVRALVIYYAQKETNKADDIDACVLLLYHYLDYLLLYHYLDYLPL